MCVHVYVRVCAYACSCVCMCMCVQWEGGEGIFMCRSTLSTYLPHPPPPPPPPPPHAHLDCCLTLYGSITVLLFQYTHLPHDTTRTKEVNGVPAVLRGGGGGRQGRRQGRRAGWGIVLLSYVRNGGLIRAGLVFRWFHLLIVDCHLAKRGGGRTEKVGGGRGWGRMEEEGREILEHFTIRKYFVIAELLTV